MDVVTARPKTALVIPTNRPAKLQAFVKAWRRAGDWDLMIVVHDGPEPIRLIDPPWPTEQVCWWDIDQVLGEQSWIISRQDSAIRCYGFWLTWARGADFVVTLDDDVRPKAGQSKLCWKHQFVMSHHPRWVRSVSDVQPRGIPYENVGTLADVVVNVGLWTGVPDIDAMQTLVNGACKGFVPDSGSRIIARGQYVPVCGMNLAVRRDVLPLCYFPPMGTNPKGEPWPYRRFDDIWAGVVLKRCLDHLGLSLSVGEPWVHHERASDPFVNLTKEATGIMANERYWEIIDEVRLTAATPIGCAREMGQGLAAHDDPYLHSWGAALGHWADLFSETTC